MAKNTVDKIDEVLVKCIRYNAIQRNSDYFDVPETARNRINKEKLKIIIEWIDNKYISATKKLDIILSNECPDYLLDLFSKGRERLRSLRNLLQNGNISAYNYFEQLKYWNKYLFNEKVIFIGLYMIVNQIFSDANHRTAIYFINLHLNVSLIETNKLVELFKSIHYKTNDFPSNNLEEVKNWMKSIQKMHNYLFKEN